MKKQLTFHHLGLVHLPASREYMSCAFTQKILKLSKMLCSLGHIVYFYGARPLKKENDIETYVNSKNFHFIETHTTEDIAKQWGNGDNRYEIGYSWTDGDFRHDFNSEKTTLTQKFYQKCIQEINKIKKPDDFILATQGRYHKPITDGVKLYLNCESGIGYRGTVKPEEINYGGWFRCWESSYGQNFSYGSDHPYASLNGEYYSRVIPNYFDPDDVEFSDEKDDYFLFIGRMIKRKGVMTAYLATKATGDKLIFAGQGAKVDTRGHLVDNHPQEFDIPNDSNWEYDGFADLEKRKKLMARAKAVFVPTEYLEMFGGVNIEARLSGTPVITTDFGCFKEYVENGLDGFRCNTLQDFVDAVEKVKKFDKDDYQRIRSRVERFLMDNVAKEYDKWFHDLYNVWESTIDDKKQGWHRVQKSS